MDINARQIDALDFNYLDQSETYQYSVDQLSRAKASTALMAKLGNEVGAPAAEPPPTPPKEGRMVAAPRVVVTMAAAAEPAPSSSTIPRMTAETK